MTESDRIEGALKTVRWPSFVRDREWKVDVDSTGDKALWVWVIISDPKDIEAEASPAWSSLRQSIREALSAEGIGLWPYIRVRAESDSEEHVNRR